MQRLAFWGAVLMILLPGLALADGEKLWKGTGEVGLLMTSGNSETESVNGKAGVKYENDRLLGEMNLAALYSSEETEIDGEKEKQTSAEKYNAGAKAGYKFTPADYVFINANYEDDRFSGYDYRTDYAIGYGRKIIDTEKTRLNLEVGPGYRYDKRDDGGIENEAVFRGHAMFSCQLSEGAAFQQDLTVLAGSDNTNTRSVTAVKAKITGALSMKASYTVDHDTHVPADKDKTDTETALTLVYDF